MKIPEWIKTILVVIVWILGSSVVFVSCDAMAADAWDNYDQNKAEHKAFCQTLDARPVFRENWLCIKNHMIVYKRNPAMTPNMGRPKIWK